jgi:signal transduction histidine kinase
LDAVSGRVQNNEFMGRAGGTLRLSSGPPTAESGRQESDHRVGWHVAYAVLAAMTAVLLVVDDGISSVDRYTGLAILAAACGWYAAVGRRALDTGSSRAGLAYVAVAMPLTIGLFLMAPFAMLLLFMLYPHVWALLPLRRAAVASAVIAVAAALRIVGWTGLSAGWLLSMVYLTVGFLVASTAIGLWIGRVIRQSKSRGELIAELAATRTELAEVSHQAGVAAERERLARDIHDTLTQGFASILLLLDATEAEIGPGNESARGHLRNARKTAQENIAEARAMITTLRPPHLRQASLPEALGQLVDRLGSQPGAQVRLTIIGDPRPLATDKEVVLLRAAQEALANVRRHAAASRVEVELGYQHEAVTLLVTDDGQGFDPGSRGSGFGLDGMRARVAQVDGTMQIRTAPGEGTTIRIDLAAPCAGAAPEPTEERS